MIDNKNYELIKFEDGDFSLDVNVSPNEDTVWLNRTEIALLFNRDIKTISKHINNALSQECSTSTVAKFAIVQKEGDRLIERTIEYFNLDVIISVSYRVKSERGIIFRRWANSILKQYVLNGQAINETKNKKIVNADINAALNIYKKYIIKSNSTDDKVNYLMSRGLTNPSRVIVAL